MTYYCEKCGEKAGECDCIEPEDEEREKDDDYEW